MTAISPYHRPGFYDEALARGRHRDIVGGRWEETGRLVLQILRDEGLQPGDRLLDIGAGALRLGCKVVPYLDPGHYWATDKSAALMRAGWKNELADKDRLPLAQLIEDEDFAFPGVPPDITHAISFAVFTHLPLDQLARALPTIRARFGGLKVLLFTVFLSPGETVPAASHRQPDGVVTHADRAPYHFLGKDVLDLTRAAGFHAEFQPNRLPRGQVLVRAVPA